MNDPDVTDPDNPEWMEQDFARARPASEVLGPELAAMLVRSPEPSGLTTIFAQQRRLVRAFDLAA